MIHPETKLGYINDEIGYGVIATSFIKKGTITWVLDELDREFTPKQFEELGSIYKDILDKYSYRNNKGNYILCWDHARYVNHSFKSNCLTTAYDYEIAIRDIDPGEQLTDDYGYLNISKPFKAYDEGTQRKVVYPDDLLNYADVWDKQLLPAFKEIPNVEQPLRSLLTKSQWEDIMIIRKGIKSMDSIRNVYYDPKK
ncbi:MAG: SET domain-containing protein [Flavobacteriaceae bacterium]|nr:SET domain-containing protein [Flavobacteriaceae bacterium]